jgi:hypothetical protein
VHYRYGTILVDAGDLGGKRFFEIVPGVQCTKQWPEVVARHGRAYDAGHDDHPAHRPARPHGLDLPLSVACSYITYSNDQVFTTRSSTSGLNIIEEFQNGALIQYK